MIGEAFRADPNKMKVITDTMNTSFGMVKESVAARNAQQPMSQAYCADGCDPTVISCCEPSKAKCPVVCKDAFSFSLEEGRASFAGKLNATQIEEWKRQHPLTEEHLLPRGLGGAADWLWESIKDGTAKVQSAIVFAADAASKTANSIVTVLVEGAKGIVSRTIEFALDAIEKVVAVAQGVFNTISESIGKVLEALSLALDLSHILEVKTTITEKVDEAWKAALADGGYLDRTATDIRGRITTIKADAADLFKTLKEKVGATSIGGEQQTADDGKNPAAGGSNANWLQSKLQQNVLPMDSSGQTSRLSPRAAPLIDIPLFVIPDNLNTEVTDLLDELKSKVTGEARKTFDEIGENFAPGTGVDLFTAGLGAIIDALAGAVDLAFDVFGAVVTSVFTIMRKLLSAIWEFMKQPITIPFVSNLYGLITSGEQLTIAGLGALLVAVPASFVIAFAKPQPQAHLAPRSKSDGYETGVIAAAAKLTVGSFLFALSEFLGEVRVELLQKLALPGNLDDKLNWLQKRVRPTFIMVNLFVVRGLDMAADGQELSGDAQIAVATVFWGLGTLAVALDLGHVLEGTETYQLISIAGGVCMAILMIVVFAAAFQNKVLLWDNKSHVFRFWDGFTEVAGLVARLLCLAGTKTPGMAVVFAIGVALVSFTTIVGGVLKMFETKAALGPKVAAAAAD
jgi:hypothetical protein